MLAKRSMFRSIRARFLLLTILLIVILFGGLGVFITRQNAAEINNSQMDEARVTTSRQQIHHIRYFS